MPTLWLLLNLFGVFLIGCASSPKHQLAKPLMTQTQNQQETNELQEKLMNHANLTSLASYKDYKVGPEDQLEVTFLGNNDLGRTVRINGEGEISLPLIGIVQVAGLSPNEVEAKLVRLYKDGRFIRNPQITVTVKEYRHLQVMVTGAVAKPGSYEMIGPRTLLEMLGKAGGLSNKDNQKAGDLVYVIRCQNAPGRRKATQCDATKPFSPGSQTIVIDLRRLLTEGALGLNIPINNGDVIYVPPAQMAYVLGAVKKPGQVAVKDNLTVTQAVALAEGLDPVLASKNISIIRFDRQGQRIIIPVNLKAVTKGEEPDPRLKENDIVYVQESGFRRFMYDFKNFMPGSFGLGASIPVF
jgi:polysaccharide export outer membrane protein